MCECLHIKSTMLNQRTSAHFLHQNHQWNRETHERFSINSHQSLTVLTTVGKTEKLPWEFKGTRMCCT